MATNLRKYTTQEVLNKVYEDSSGNTIGINAATAKETLNAALDEANSRLNVSLAGGTITGDLTISGDLTVEGGGILTYDETIEGGTFGIIGGEGEDAEIFLFADEGDDNADKWRIVASTNGNMYFRTYASGAYKSSLAIGSGSVVVNEDSVDMDFRIESDSDTHAFFLKGSTGNVGIGTAAPDGKVHIESGSAGTIGTLSYADELIIENSGGGGISIRTPDGNSGNIVWQSATNDTVARIYGSYNSGNELLAFETSGTERMILDDNSRISLSNNDGNTSNTVFGKNAFTNAGTVLGDVGADSNIAIGEDAMGTGTTTDATFNTAVGYKSLEDITAGDFNTGIGAHSIASLTDGQANIGVGYATGYTNISGDFNTAVGHIALYQNTTHNNTAVGYSAGYFTQGAGNTYVGFSAGKGASGAEANNVAVGSSALLAVTTGSGNVALGSSAGDVITTGGQNTIIGADSDPGAADAVNQTIVGYGIGGVLDVDNSVVLGNASVTDVYMAQDSGAYVHSQNVPNHVANTMSAPYYRFDGVDDYVNTNETFQTTYRGDFSIAMMIKVIDGNPSAVESLWGASESDTNDRVYMSINTNGTVELKYKDGSTQLAPTTTSAIFTDGENPWKHIVVVIDAVNNLALFYDNGTSVAVTSSDLSSLDFSTIALTQNAVIGARNQAGLYGHFDGSISDVKIFNNALTATEVKELYSGASVPFKYKGASQTELITDSDNTDFNDGTINDWAVSTNGNGTVTYSTASIGGADNKQGLITVGSTAGSYTHADLADGFISAFTAGKIYRVKANVYIPSANNNWTEVRLVFDNYSGSSIISETQATLGTEDSWQSLEVVLQMGTDVAGSLLLVARSTTTGDLVYFDDITITQIGAVAEYDGSGIGASRWDDKSGNDLHGTVTGATVENAPADADSGLTYEEGTFTPTILLGGTEISTNSGTYNSGQTQGSYTKIGNRVLFNMRVGITNKGGETGDMRVAGLPFTVGANPQSVAALSLTMWVVSYADTPFAQADESSSSVGLFEVTNSGTYSTLTDGNLAAGATAAFIQIAGNYHI
jgi:hypothetical protein